MDHDTWGQTILREGSTCGHLALMVAFWEEHLDELDTD